MIKVKKERGITEFCSFILMRPVRLYMGSTSFTLIPCFRIIQGQKVMGVLDLGDSESTPDHMNLSLDEDFANLQDCLLHA